MGIEPTWSLFRGHTGFEARRPVDATDDDDAPAVVGRMVGQAAADAGPPSAASPLSLVVVREVVSACDELPEHIRAAVLALLETVPVGNLQGD